MLASILSSLRTAAYQSNQSGNSLACRRVGFARILGIRLIARARDSLRTMSEIVDMNADMTSIAVEFEERTWIMCRLGVALISEELGELIKECFWHSIQTIQSAKQVPDWL